MNKDCAMKRPVGYEYEKSDYCLCLAIHAPRKGIVEVLYLGFDLPSMCESMSVCM